MTHKLVLILSFVMLMFSARSITIQNGKLFYVVNMASAQDEFADDDEDDLEEEISQAEEAESSEESEDIADSDENEDKEDEESEELADSDSDDDEADDDDEEEFADSDEDDDDEEEIADSDDDFDDFDEDDDDEEIADSDEDDEEDSDDDFDDFDEDEEEIADSDGEQDEGLEHLEADAEEPADDIEVAEPAEESVPVEQAPDEEFAEDTDAQFAQVELAPDEPDTQLEAKLYDIYVNFHSEQTSSEQWDVLVGGKQSEAYGIQPGDTLWGISETLFGDGNYWPKVWSLNGTITNPHLVTPGHSIRFLLGDEGEAPAFTVTEAESTTEDGAGQEVVAEEEQQEVIEATEEKAQAVADFDDSEDVEIPPPTRVSRPVLMRLPPSLPMWQSQDTAGNYDDSGIDYEKRKILDLKDELPLSSYVVAKPPQSAGTIIEVESGGELASDYQYVYLAFKKGSVSIGDKLLAVRYESLKAANDTIEGELGYRVEVQGEIEVVDSLQTVIEDAEENLEYYRGMVVRSVNPVRIHSELIAGKIKDVVLNMDGERSDVVAQVIGSQYDKRRHLHGPQSIVFLNRGSNQGIAEGHILPIRSNRRVRVPNTVLSENIRPIGYVKIAHVQSNYSTAFVLRAWDDIQSGDFTGKGQLMATVQHGLDANDSDLGDDEFDDEGDDDDNDDDDADELDSDMEMAEGEADEDAFVNEGDEDAEDDGQEGSEEDSEEDSDEWDTF